MRITKRQLRRIINEETAAGDNLSIEEIVMLEQDVVEAKEAVIAALNALQDYTHVLEPALLNIKRHTARPSMTDRTWSTDLSERFHSCEASLYTLLQKLRHRAVSLEQRRERIEKSGNGAIV